MNKTKILIITDGNAALGLGHIMRSLSLARELDSWADVCFTSQNGSKVETLINECGFTYIESAPGKSENIENFDPACVIYDLPPSKDYDELGISHGMKGKVIGIHDMGLGYLRGDIIVDGSVVENKEVPSCRVVQGPEYMILDSSFRKIRSDISKKTGTGNIISICTGGGVANDLIPRILVPLSEIHNVNLRLIAGPCYSDTEINEFERILPLGSELIQTTTQMARYLAESSVALVGGGVSLYESLCVGTPTAAVSLNTHQKRTVKEFERRGAVINLGLLKNLSKQKIKHEITKILHDKQKTGAMIEIGKRLVDGEGAARVSELLHGLMFGKLEHVKSNYL